MVGRFFSLDRLPVSLTVLTVSSKTLPKPNAKNAIKTVRPALQQLQNAHHADSSQASIFSWTLPIKFVFKYVLMELLRILKILNAILAMMAV